VITKAARIALLLLGAALTPALAPALGPAFAQVQKAAEAIPEPTKPMTAADLESLRAELRSSKKQFTASTLKLTDAEATRFWPVYDQYIAELTVINDSRYGLIAEYAGRFGRYDDKAASDFITRWLDVDVKTAALRAKYVPIVGKVLPGVKAATFFQIDRRISMAIDLKVATMLPVLQTQSQIKQ